MIAGRPSPRRVCSKYTFSINRRRLDAQSFKLLASQSIATPRDDASHWDTPVAPGTTRCVMNGMSRFSRRLNDTPS